MAVVEEAWQERLDRLLGARSAAAQLHQRSVDGDTVEPGSELAASFEAGQGPEGLEEGVLDGVPGVFLVGEKTPAHGQQTPAVADHQFMVGSIVAGAETQQERLGPRLAEGRRIHPLFDH